MRNVLDVPATCGILSSKKIEITGNWDAVALIEKLGKGELASLEVTTAFCKRAAIAQQLINCLTEIFFEQAMARAKECHAYLAEHGKPMGPFHGLPISLKDCFNVKGVAGTVGLVSFIDRPVAESNSSLVEILMELGAVLYVKTNIPQSMMTGDSENNVFGRTLNPNRLCLGAGGSSGGEGALLGIRGSPIGVGTDIAGSIRIPAYVNGTFGSKPSEHRVPAANQVSCSRRGSFGIRAVVGPLARSLRDIDYFMEAVLDRDAWNYDPDALGVLWRTPALQAASKPKLTLGLLLEDETRPLHPPVLRAMKTAIKGLEAAGHRIIDLSRKLPTGIFDKVMRSAMQSFVLDPAKTGADYIKSSGEPFIASLAKSSLPALTGYQPSLDDAWELSAKRSEFREIIWKVYVNEKLDAVLLPAFSGTAVAHDAYGLPMYTVLANLLNVSAIVMIRLKPFADFFSASCCRSAVLEGGQPVGRRVSAGCQIRAAM